MRLDKLPVLCRSLERIKDRVIHGQLGQAQRRLPGARKAGSQRVRSAKRCHGFLDVGFLGREVNSRLLLVPLESDAILLKPLC